MQMLRGFNEAGGGLFNNAVISFASFLKDRERGVVFVGINEFLEPGAVF